MSQSIPLSTLYLPNIVVYQTQAAALVAGETVVWNPSQPPQYWKATLPAGFDPDAPFTIHNLHNANGTAVWGISYIPNSQAIALNIPPDQSGSNPIVYPPSVPIPMTFPLPSNESIIGTPFGLILTTNDPSPAAGSPAPAGTDATLARVLTNSQMAVTLLKGTPV